MTQYFHNGRRIFPGRPWTSDGGKDSPPVQHPANWNIWSEETMRENDVTVVNDQKKPPKTDDQRYSGPAADGSWAVVDLPLSTVVSEIRLSLKTRRDEIINGLFLWDGHILQGDPASAIRMQQARDLMVEHVKRGVPAASVLQPWRTADNKYTPPLTSTQIHDMVFTKGKQVQSAWKTWSGADERVLSAETAEDARSIEASVAWPVVPVLPVA